MTTLLSHRILNLLLETERDSIWNSTTSPARNRSLVYPSIVSPLRLSFSYTHDSEERVRPPVRGLFKHSSPPAVFRGVVSIVVDSVYRHFARRFYAHVGKEVIKVSPSVAHGNSAPPVVGVVCRVFVVASRDHAAPCSVLRAFCHTVGKIALLKHFLVSAFARRGVSRSKVTSGYGFDSPAVAQANPFSSADSVSSVLKQDCQFPEFLSKQIGYRTYSHFRHLENHLDNRRVATRGETGVRVRGPSHAYGILP